MNNLMEPALVVCDVPIELNVRLSITHRSQNVLRPEHSAAQDSNTGPRQSESAVATPASAGDEEVRSLYVAVAENSPELLRGMWYRLHMLVCADPSAWVYPGVLAMDGDDVYEPAHVDEAALALVWPMLLQRARKVPPPRRAGK
jgi:hypothetical protein